ncbi:hypothetical protein [uncultured Alistipes sp.]|uniref:hypothetical protein n=1 Tax=uncultured Alistipes sp. TaxID=538949 RepID=UPI00262E05AA|nr:hypothetical protein [uncultured Alistipes sp.]
MIEFEKITPKEIETYTTRLVPKLLRIPPYKWTPIDDIAKDVARFIAICQHLADRGYFQDEAGYSILEVKEDEFVRLDPMYIRRHDTKTFRIWK